MNTAEGNKAGFPYPSHFAEVPAITEIDHQV